MNQETKCQNVLLGLNSLLGQKVELERELASSEMKVNQLKEKKQEMVKALESLEAEVSIGHDFLQTLFSADLEAAVTRYVENSPIVGYLDVEPLYSFLEERMAEWQTSRRLTSKQYKKFLSVLLSERYKSTFANYLRNNQAGTSSDGLSLINSLFLNKCLSDDEVLEIDFPLPEKISQMDFGIFLRRGKIRIKEARSQAFAYASGGDFKVEKHGAGLGAVNRGATIRAKKGGINVGYGAKKGTFIVSEAESGFAEGATGGTFFLDRDKNGINNDGSAGLPGSGVGAHTKGATIIVNHAGHKAGAAFERGTLLLNNYTEMPPFFTRGIYCYDHDHWAYWTKNLQSLGQLIEAHGSEFLASFIEQKYGLFVYNPSNEEAEVNPTEGLDGGIIVINYLPDKDIGKGMISGALIIENRSVQYEYEEVRKRLSPDRQGGLVLLRVPDPENPDRTKLEVVE